MKFNVPLERVLYPPDDPHPATTKGDDIKAVKRIVSRAGFWPWQEFDKEYSNVFAHGQKKAGKPIKGKEGVAGLQKSLRLKPDGIWDDEVHYKSLKLKVPKGKIHYGEFIWDQFALNLYKGFDDLSSAEQLVVDIFEWWDYLVAREPQVHYDQGRPINIIRYGNKPPKMPISEDCSGTFIGCAWLAGAKSPDRSYGYSGSGNTDSLIDGGFNIRVSDIEKYCKKYYIGGFYGPSPWDTTHVVAVKSPTQIYSHGREGGPEIRNNIYYHPQPLIAVKAYDVL